MYFLPLFPCLTSPLPSRLPSPGGSGGGRGVQHTVPSFCCSFHPSLFPGFPTVSPMGSRRISALLPEEPPHPPFHTAGLQIFVLLPPLFSHTLSQRLPQHSWWAHVCPVLGPWQNWLCPLCPAWGSPISPQRAHPAAALTASTSPGKPNTGQGNSQHR